MNKAVCPLIDLVKFSNISFSLIGFNEEVGSSHIKRSAFLFKARAIASFCHSPPESSSPPKFLSSLVFFPFERFPTKLVALAFSITSYNFISS